MGIGVRSIFNRIRKRRRVVFLVALGGVVLGFVGINVIAYRQAWAMTHFVEGGVRTRPPEGLGLMEKIRVGIVGVHVPRPVDEGTPGDVGLGFQTFRFGGVSHDDCEGWFISAGEHKGLVIGFHAYAASKSSLLGQGKAFHDLGYDVLLVDFRGSGGSRGNDTTHGYREAEDVAAASDFASHRWAGEAQIFYGQSMGGAAILRAIGDLKVEPRGAIIESSYDRMMSIAGNRFHAMGLPAFGLARLLVFWEGWQFGYDAFEQNPADYATRVHCPVLMMQGSLDRRVTNAQARNLFEHLAGPREFELFDHAGHCGFMQADRERWERDVGRFAREWSSRK